MRLCPPRFFFGVLLANCLPLLSIHAAPKIGVLLKGTSPFWDAMEKGAREAAAKTGAEIIVKKPRFETDIGVQVQMLNALAAQGAEAIVIAPSSKDALAVPVASIAVKGVKFIVLDTQLSGKTASVFIGTNHEAAGAAAGKLLASLVAENDEVSLLRHSQASGATAMREIAALAAFHDAHPKKVVHSDIYASAEQGTEVEKCQLLLSKYPNTKGILATGTPGTLAMMKVLQDKNLGGTIKFVGCGFNLSRDVAAAIENGTISGWIAQLPKDIGERGVLSAVALLKGEPVPPIIYTDFLVITKDNLHDPKVQALLSL